MKNLEKKQYIQDLSKLIAVKTLTSDSAQNRKALDFIVSKINKRAVIKRIKNDGVEILIASNTERYVHITVI